MDDMTYFSWFTFWLHEMDRWITFESRSREITMRLDILRYLCCCRSAGNVDTSSDGKGDRKALEPLDLNQVSWLLENYCLTFYCCNYINIIAIKSSKDYLAYCTMCILKLVKYFWQESICINQSFKNNFFLISCFNFFSCSVIMDGLVGMFIS